MKNRRNYYRILNVQPDAPDAVIRSSYRTMMQRLRMHPDLGGDASRAATVNEAYAALSDRAGRAAYDAAHRDSVWAGHLHRFRRAADSAGAKDAGPDCGCSFCGFPRDAGEDDGDSARCANCHSPLQALRPLAAGSDDRRIVERLPCAMSLRFYTHWPQSRPCRGRIRDISPGGLSFACNTGVVQGQLVKLESEVFSAVGRIVRNRWQGQRWELAARFVSASFSRQRGVFVEYRA